MQIILQDRWWLLGCLLPLLLLLRLPKHSPFTDRSDRSGNTLIAAGFLGILFTLSQSFAVNDFGAVSDLAEAIFGPQAWQSGLGIGAVILLSNYIYMIALGYSSKGAIRGDTFSVLMLISIIALVGTFVGFPLLKMLVRSLIDGEDVYALSNLTDRLFNDQLWGVSCVYQEARNCGVAFSTLFLAVMTGLSTTFLGLAFALVITRTNFFAKRMLRGLSILPTITPPFVVGLALILLFGRTGTITTFLSDSLGVELGDWIYGFWGLWLAKTISYTPIAFLVLIGVVEGVAPSMEEASQTLKGGRWQTFSKVSFPLIKPGIANAFLLGFVESMADLGNPLVIGGDYQVLSAEIFYAIAGATADSGRAAALAMTLLMFTCVSFAIQKKWVGNKTYTTMTGKGDGGRHMPMPNIVKGASLAVALPWALLTAVIYAMIVYGGFVETWGLNHTLTLTHYKEAFGLDFSSGSLVATGAAWDSMITTVVLALIAMPLTTLVGIITAYMLSRQSFPGKALFELGTMLSFAIPGIVIGIAYVVAFNQAPIDLTYTGMIIVICFVFRNMPVGVRSGIASMSQLDKGLDEAALTLEARSSRVFRTIILPLIKPAVISSMIYSFVRAVTSVSAVIFLVSADYNLTSAFIISMVENTKFGVAIAYATTLILLMAIAIVLLQLIIGKRKIFQRSSQKI